VTFEPTVATSFTSGNGTVTGVVVPPQFRGEDAITFSAIDAMMWSVSSTKRAGLATAYTGIPYSDVVQLEIVEGSNPFASGDEFTVTVARTYIHGETDPGTHDIGFAYVDPVQVGFVTDRCNFVIYLPGIGILVRLFISAIPRGAMFSVYMLDEMGENAIIEWNLTENGYTTVGETHYSPTDVAFGGGAPPNPAQAIVTSLGDNKFLVRCIAGFGAGNEP